MEVDKPLYKAYEMEERLDIWFFHPLGLRLAKTAKTAGMTPDQVTYVSMLTGVAGGFMLAAQQTALAGVAFLVLSSVLDSADGQLARMTGGGTLKGRILDGMIGYAMFTAAYIGLAVMYVRQHGTGEAAYIAALMLAAGVCTALQSSLYDFYRTTFASVVAKARVDTSENTGSLGLFFRLSYAGYNFYQKLFASSHLQLKNALAKISPGGSVSEHNRQAYLNANRRIIHGWNLLGDNTRFILILAAVVTRRPEWYFFFIIFCVTLAMLALAFAQRSIDKGLMREYA